jgi:hypothetical protein
MRQRTVYLSGPITGRTLPQAVDWRVYVTQRLAPAVLIIDPMRDAVDSSVPSRRQLSDSERLAHLLHGKEVLDRNRMDIARSDLVLVNLLGADATSIGAIGEIFWADAFRKPVILVREDSYNIHDHGIVNAIACSVCSDLDSAIAKTKSILLPGQFAALDGKAQ